MQALMSPALVEAFERDPQMATILNTISWIITIIKGLSDAIKRINKVNNI